MRRNIHVLCGGIYRSCIVDNALPSNLFKITKQKNQCTAAGIRIKKPPTS